MFDKVKNLFKKDRIDVIDIEKEMKRRERKEKREVMKRALLAWAIRNPGAVATFGTAVASSAFGLAKMGIRAHRQSAEERKLTYRVYDPSNGYYIYTRKPLNNSQKIQLDNMRKSGMSVTEALSKMGMVR